MELIAAILFAAPLGYFCRTRRLGLGLYLLVWAIVFPIQTVGVHESNPDDIEPLYFVINAVILAVGIGLNRLGARFAARRAKRVPA